MKIKMKDQSVSLPNAWKQCGLSKADWDRLQSGKTVDATSVSESIKNLVELIAEQMNYGGKIIWDKSKPDGQPRRCLDTTKAESFGFEAETSLKEGLKETIEWFNDNRNSLF